MDDIDIVIFIYFIYVLFIFKEFIDKKNCIILKNIV